MFGASFDICDSGFRTGFLFPCREVSQVLFDDLFLANLWLDDVEFECDAGVMMDKVLFNELAVRGGRLFHRCLT